MDGEKETIIMGAAEVICCFFLEEKIHNRPEISDHFHTHVPEVRKTHMQCKTLWEWFGRQEGGMAGEVLPLTAQKTKSRTHS